MRGAQYSILILAPTGYAHHHAFDEVALGLGHGLSALGWRVFVTRNPAEVQGRTIVLGANLLRECPDYHPPSDAVLFNLEQLDDQSPWLDQRYRAALLAHEVWDYSPRNLDFLARLGARHARLCPIGYVPALTRIPILPDTIDVLLYGSLTPRRIDLLRALAAADINVVPLFGVYGMERDAYIAQARIVLNLHADVGHIFEIVRVSYLLANRRFVISETGSDPALEAPFRSGVAFGDLTDIPALCRRYLADAPARQAMAEEGFRQFSRYLQADYLLPLVGRPAVESLSS